MVCSWIYGTLHTWNNGLLVKAVGSKLNKMKVITAKLKNYYTSIITLNITITAYA